MKKKSNNNDKICYKQTLIFLIIACIAFIYSCSFDSSSEAGKAIDVNANSTSSVFAHNTSSRNITTNEEDAFDSVTVNKSINIDLSTPSSSDSEIVITTNYGVELSSTITGVLEINLSGTLAGGFTILSSSTTSAYVIKLNGVEITSTHSPSLNLLQADCKYYVNITGVNTLIDNSTKANRKTSSYDQKASLYCAGSLLLSGSGTLNITSNYKHAIICEDYIRVFDGNYNINTDTGDGIRATSGFIFDDGNLVLNATYDTEADSESKGIRVKGTESDTLCGEGFIVIKDGNIDITTIGKAITANWDPDEDDDGTLSNNPDPYVYISGGKIKIVTTGTPYEYTEDGETLSLSPEGIEGKTYVKIDDGEIDITSTDDCINAGEKITINGGSINCYSSKNDAIDSNGTLVINGGIIVSRGTTIPECAFDCDNYTFEINGGTIVGIGSSNYSTPTSSACTQNVLLLSNSVASANSTMAIVDDEGKIILAYEIPSSFEVMVLSSPKLQSLTNYTIWNDVNASSSKSYNGLHYEDVVISGGSSKTSFTLSESTVSGIGTVTSGGAMEGMPGMAPGR